VKGNTTTTTSHGPVLTHPFGQRAETTKKKKKNLALKARRAGNMQPKDAPPGSNMLHWQ
jgi:hypothetical protein